MLNKRGDTSIRKNNNGFSFICDKNHIVLYNIIKDDNSYILYINNTTIIYDKSNLIIDTIFEFLNEQYAFQEKRYKLKNEIETKINCLEKLR